MKKLFYTALIFVLITVTFTSCLTTKIDSNKEKRQIKGSGEKVAKTEKTNDLNKLSEKHRDYCLKTAQRYIDAGLLKLKVTQGQAPCYLTLTREGLFVSDMIISDLMLVYT